jgi:hypothetical protein
LPVIRSLNVPGHGEQIAAQRRSGQGGTPHAPSTNEVRACHLIGFLSDSPHSDCDFATGISVPAAGDAGKARRGGPLRLDFG